MTAIDGGPVLVEVGDDAVRALDLVAALIDDPRITTIIISRAPAVQPAPGRSSHALSARERQVAREVCRGASAREIGLHLHISERTVESHVASTYRKLGINSRFELMRLAPGLGL